MNTPGIIGTIQLAATLVFAIPVGLMGVEKFFAGQTFVGLAFVGVAALMVGLQQYLTTPMDIPTAAAEKTAGVLTKEKKK